MADFTIRRITDVADVRAAAVLFDHPPQPAASERFVASADHHLLIAYVGEQPAGMVTGVELTHPDKGTEMFLYELGVDQRYRRRGIGSALTRALSDLAREHGCYGMWVLTDADNEAALGTYRSLGSVVQESNVGFTWSFAEEE
ncbi:GNAT family N-acetyltransferase [Microlunatus soli]|uniref:Ribosomal protein S18 acetylase RimI n=1 Tax=Microlunatus soli TaxID=630515 RepID=A0A1H1V5B7_9ACTN|nr:GNAT family N-acetyltransferase [Microlunatus soli]SDS79469.1 Ribosomal protein S18 acetylase RimI [Microlunatus soli]